MARDVHIHVCFPCTCNSGVAAIAAKHLEKEYASREAEWFLQDLAGRSGCNPGTKGGLSLWGIVGNYTDAEQFVKDLSDFWKELFVSELASGPMIFEKVIVFYEVEQSEHANCWQISISDDPKRELTFEHFEKLPFSWGTY